MSEQIELKLAKCKHCGEPIARIPYFIFQPDGNSCLQGWSWVHIPSQCGRCEIKTSAEPIEEESE